MDEELPELSILKKKMKRQKLKLLKVETLMNEVIPAPWPFIEKALGPTPPFKGP